MKTKILTFSKDPGKVILKGIKQNIEDEIKATMSIFRDKEWARTEWMGKRAS